MTAAPLSRILRRIGLAPLPERATGCCLDVAPLHATVDAVRFRKVRGFLLVRGVAPGGRRTHVWIRLRGPVRERLEKAARVGFGFLNVSDGERSASIAVSPALARSLHAALDDAPRGSLRAAPGRPSLPRTHTLWPWSV